MSLEFLITAFIVVIVPGTGVIYTLAVGLARGGTASIAAAAGCTFGGVPHVLTAILGLAALLHTSAVAFQIVKYAGAAYLLYMAWMILKQRGALEVTPEKTEKSLFRIALTGALINILNPKLSIFFLAFLPQFIPADSNNPIPHMLFLSSIFLAMTFGVFVCYGLFATGIRHRLLGAPAAMKWMRRAFATVFIGLGVKLASETI